MGFGRKKEKKGNENDSKHSEVSKETVSKNNNIDSNDNSINNSGGIVGDNLKQKRAARFIRKLSKKNSSQVLLFGKTKEEKLEQFIENIKIIHPNMPKFWLQKEIDKFKKKFKM